MRFSQRIGKKPVSKSIQLESIDEELKNQLWNVTYDYFIKPDEIRSRSGNLVKFDDTLPNMWHNFYKLPVDTIPYVSYDQRKFIRNRFFKDEWFEVYDFMEFLINSIYHKTFVEKYIKIVNKILEKQFSAYRIVNNLIAPISNQLEFEEVEDSLNNTKQLTALKGANVHLNHALNLISDKKSPQYRNSIKESISAVEATCRYLTDENTLGKALSKLEKKGIDINAQLKAGFTKVYAYTNDRESGIRHAIVSEPKEPDFHDAKYMLIACSSFINYLIGKHNQN